MITTIKSGSSTLTFDQSVTVRMDGKVVGQIKQDKDGLWHYTPTGSKAGDGFPSLKACQLSLQ